MRPTLHPSLMDRCMGNFQALSYHWLPTYSAAFIANAAMWPMAKSKQKWEPSGQSWPSKGSRKRIKWNYFSNLVMRSFKSRVYQQRWSLSFLSKNFGNKACLHHTVQKRAIPRVTNVKSWVNHSFGNLAQYDQNLQLIQLSGSLKIVCKITFISNLPNFSHKNIQGPIKVVWGPWLKLRKRPLLHK